MNNKRWIIIALATDPPPPLFTTSHTEDNAENVLDRIIMQLYLQCTYIGIKAYNTIFKKNRGNTVTNAICMNIIKYMVLLTYV